MQLQSKKPLKTQNQTVESLKKTTFVLLQQQQQHFHKTHITTTYHVLYRQNKKNTLKY